MKNNLKSSIVIRTHNHKKLLENLLRKIKEQKKVPKPEIVIIDSSSTDGTKEFATKEGCKVIQIKPEDFTHAYTFNLGVKNSGNEIIIFASVDIIPKNTLWLFRLLEPFKDEKVAGVFSKQEPIKNFNLIEEFKLKKIFRDNGTTLANFSNASGAIRREILTKIKYNENVPYPHIGGEDQQIIVEIKKRGYKIIYEPKSIVYHSHKYHLKILLRQAYLNGKHEKEVTEWNKNVSMLYYSKKDLLIFLFHKKAFKDIIFIFPKAILLRVSYLLGKFSSSINPSNHPLK